MILLLTSFSHASEIRNLSIEHRWTDWSGNGSRMLELPGDTPPFQYSSLTLNVQLLGPVYFDNLIHMLTGSSKVQWVGWRWEFGVKPCRAIEIFYQHHSQHALDHIQPSVNFPVEDMIGIRWNLIGDGRTR